MIEFKKRLRIVLAIVGFAFIAGTFVYFGFGGQNGFTYYPVAIGLFPLGLFELLPGAFSNNGNLLPWIAWVLYALFLSALLLIRRKNPFFILATFLFFIVLTNLSGCVYLLRHP